MIKIPTQRKQQRQGVYFLSLGVQNMRCFGPEQTLNLTTSDSKPAMWTIILANNASGKTTLLQALWGASLEVASIPDARNESKNSRASPEWTQRGFFEAELSGFVRKPHNSSKLSAQYCLMNWLKSQDISWTAELEVFHSHRLSDGWGVVGNTITAPIPNFSPIYAYGASRVGYKTQSQRYTGFPTLFSETEVLIDAESWITNLDHNYLRGDPTAKNRLEMAKNLLIAVLPDVIDVRISSPRNSRESPILEFETSFGWMSLDRLSLGYRSMISWMVDFMAHMVDAYPDSEDPLAEPAICLIDEIDLHLHPKWQREIVDYLSERFPRTQFIVTAHSPLVVQSATQANIVLLRQPEGKDWVEIINDPPDVRNWRLDQILTSDLFGLPSARPKELDEPLAERDQILKKKAITKKDRDRLVELDAIIEKTPGGETIADSESMA